VIHETQRGGRFQHFSTLQLHAVAGVGRVLVENGPEDLPEHDARLDAAPRENAGPDMRGADTNKPEKTVALGFENGCMLSIHR
jgi:hypothetical protein